MPPPELDGRTALITGSTRSLGRAIALRLAAAGAQTVVCGRTTAAAEQVAAECRALGPDSRAVTVDLGLADGPAELVAAAEDAFGAVDVLVNCAIARSHADRDGAVADVTRGAWLDILAVNFLAGAELCRLCVPGMVERGGGAIVNVSSMAAVRGAPGHTAYAASKAALESLARAIAADYPHTGVRCNNVRLGSLHDPERADPEREARYARMRAARATTVEDVAELVLLLAGERGAGITAATFDVDGGATGLRAKVVG